MTPLTGARRNRTPLPVTVRAEIPLTRDQVLHALGTCVMEQLLTAEGQSPGELCDSDTSTDTGTGILTAGITATTTDEPGGVEDAVALAHRTISAAVTSALRAEAPALLPEVRRRAEGLTPVSGISYQVPSSEEWHPVTAHQIRSGEIRAVAFAFAARHIGGNLLDRTKTVATGTTIIAAVPHEPVIDVMTRLASHDGPAVIVMPEDGQPDGFRILYVEPR